MTIAINFKAKKKPYSFEEHGCGGCQHASACDSCQHANACDNCIKHLCENCNKNLATDYIPDPLQEIQGKIVYKFLCNSCREELFKFLCNSCREESL